MGKHFLEIDSVFLLGNADQSFFLEIIKNYFFQLIFPNFTSFKANKITQTYGIKKVPHENYKGLFICVYKVNPLF